MRILLSILCLTLITLNADAAESQEKQSLTDAKTQEAHVLLIHGLNQRPSHLHALENLFIDLGYRTTILALKGHRSEKDCAIVLDNAADIWTEQVHSAIEKVSGPVILVGYSLGALLALEASETSEIKALILFAPPVALRFKAHALRLLLPFRHFGLSLPSYAPEESRHCPKTSLRRYHGLFTIRATLAERAANTKLPPLLVFADPKDELVSFSGVDSWLKQTAATSSTLYKIESEQKELPAHLVVDPLRLGAEEWRRVKEKIADFLQSPP